MPTARAAAPRLRAVPAGGRAHRGGVGAGLRLGEREGGDPLAAGALRQHARLLLLAAEQLDRHRAQLALLLRERVAGRLGRGAHALTGVRAGA